MALLYPNHNGQNWSQPLWSLADDNAQNHVKPGAGDSVALTANSDGVDIDENVGALAGVDMTGYTSYLSTTGAWIVDIDGDLKLGGNVDAAANSLLFEVSGNFEALTGLSVTGDVSLKHNDVAANARTVKTRGLCGDIKFEINNPGITSLTVSEDGGTIIKWKSFDLKANAKYAGGAFDHEISGDLLIDTAAATFTTTGTWEQTASGDVKNAKTTWTKLLLAMLVSTTSRVVGTTQFGAFEHGDGSITQSGGQMLYIRHPGDNFWIAGDGSITVDTVQIYSANSRAVGKMYLSNVGEFKIRLTAGNTLTMDGDLDAANTTIIPRPETAGMATLDMNGHSLFGTVHLGGAAADRLGKVLLRNGSHKIGSIQASLDTQVGCEVDFGSSHITMTGTILGIQGVNEMIVTSNDARIRGGTVTGVNCTGRLWCQPQTVTDGTGNSDKVIFRPKPIGIGMGVAA